VTSLNEQGQFFAQHFIGKLQAFEALELSIVLLSFHSRCVPKDAIEHLLLGHLKAVLVRDLLLVT